MLLLCTIVVCVFLWYNTVMTAVHHASTPLEVSVLTAPCQPHREVLNSTLLFADYYVVYLPWFGHNPEWRLIGYHATRALYCLVTGERSQGRQAKSGWKTSGNILGYGIYNLKMPYPAAKIELHGDSSYHRLVMTDEKEEEEEDLFVA